MPIIRTSNNSSSSKALDLEDSVPTPPTQTPEVSNHVSQLLFRDLWPKHARRISTRVTIGHKTTALTPVPTSSGFGSTNTGFGANSTTNTGGGLFGNTGGSGFGSGGGTSTLRFRIRLLSLAECLGLDLGSGRSSESIQTLASTAASALTLFIDTFWLPVLFLPLLL